MSHQPGRKDQSNIFLTYWPDAPPPKSPVPFALVRGWMVTATDRSQPERPTTAWLSRNGGSPCRIAAQASSPSVGTRQPTAGATQSSPPAAGATQASPPAPIDLSKLPPPPDLRSPPGNTGKLLSDAEVLRMLLGTRKYKDAYGDFFLTLDSKREFSTHFARRRRPVPFSKCLSALRSRRGPGS